MWMEDILRDEILTSKEEINKWVTHVQNFSVAKYCYPKLSSEYLSKNALHFIQLLQSSNYKEWLSSALRASSRVGRGIAALLVTYPTRPTH